MKYQMLQCEYGTEFTAENIQAKYSYKQHKKQSEQTGFHLNKRKKAL